MKRGFQDCGKIKFSGIILKKIVSLRKVPKTLVSEKRQKLHFQFTIMSKPGFHDSAKMAFFCLRNEGNGLKKARCPRYHDFQKSSKIAFSGPKMKKFCRTVSINRSILSNFQQ